METACMGIQFFFSIYDLLDLTFGSMTYYMLTKSMGEIAEAPCYVGL